jgi:hypothetical protein
MFSFFRNSLSALTIAMLLSVVGCNTNVAVDTDHDGSTDLIDNCPTTANANQSDVDTDGLGDSCDNCPDESNADQEDQDGDGYGATCDSADLNPLVH